MASAEPATPIVIEGKKYRAVHEGLASVLAPYGEESQPTGKHVRNNDEGNQAVFYNPIQQFNRDLSVLAITVYGEGALVEKESRFNQKNKNANKKKAKNKQMPCPELSESTERNPEIEHSNPLKRKSDHLEPQSEDSVAADTAKKTKVREDLETGEDVVSVEEPNENGQTAHSIEPTGDTATDQAKAKPEYAKKQLPFTILDALSATGLRALRYSKEIPFATNIVANDLLPASVQTIDLNVKHNDVQDKVHSNLGDARVFMYSKVGNEQPRHREAYVHRFDVIDLDPYGTAASFFDASLQALQDGGMLCVTCTDAGVFASTGYPEKTYALYGGMPIKGPHSHEGGLRLILNSVAVSAARYGLAIEPLLSLYIDYYARLFIRVHRKQQEVKLLAGTTMTVYNCGHGCGAWTTQPLLRNVPQTSKSGETFYKFSFAQAPLVGPGCEHCGSRMHLCGPMWAGLLHNPHFVQKMLDRIPSLDKKVYGTTDRLQGMLTLALEEDLTTPPTKPEAAEVPEAKADDQRIIPRIPSQLVDVAPFFIMPTQLAKVIHCATPSEDAMRGALLGLGYRVSRSHCKAGSIKTNAPWSVLWEIIREFMRTQAPIKEGAVKKGTPGWSILRRLRGTEVASVSALKDNLKEQLGKCETKEDLKTVVQSMLWRLENEKPFFEGSAPEPPQAVNGGPQEAHHSAPAEKEGQARRSRSRSPPALDTSKLNIVFDEKLGREKPRGKLVRYQMNPRENWGPMNRAGRST